MHVLYFTNTTWLALPTTGAPDTLASASVSSLDHDTLTWVTYTNSSIYTLNVNDLSADLTWQLASSAPFAADLPANQALIGQSSNHYMIFGGSNLDVGQSHIYVLHFNYYQPAIQTFGATSGGDTSFPQTPGSTTTQLNETTPGAFWYIPDDPNQVYLVTQTDSTNSTAVYPAPSTKLSSSSAAYAADLTNLVQYDFSTGNLYYIDGSSTSNPWAQIKGLTASDFVAKAGTMSSSASSSSSSSSSASSSSASSSMPASAAMTSSKTSMAGTTTQAGSTPSPTTAPSPSSASGTGLLLQLLALTLALATGLVWIQ